MQINSTSWKRETERYTFDEKEKCYRIKTNLVGITCKIFIAIADEALRLQERKVLARYSQAEEGEKLTLTVKFDNAIEECSNRMIEKMKPPTMSVHLPELIELTEDQRQECFRKAKEFTKRKIPTIDVAHRVVTSLEKLPDQITEWHYAFHAFTDDFWAENGDVPLDFSRTRIYTAIGTYSPLDLDCGLFAFSISQDTNLINYFNRHGKGPDELYTADYRKMLNNWGYSVVIDPAVGDLVVYENDAVATHYALYRNDQEVISKKGNFAKKICRHHVTNISANYGNLFRFFRRN